MKTLFAARVGYGSSSSRPGCWDPELYWVAVKGLKLELPQSVYIYIYI